MSLGTTSNYNCAWSGRCRDSIRDSISMVVGMCYVFCVPGTSVVSGLGVGRLYGIGLGGVEYRGALCCVSGWLGECRSLACVFESHVGDAP